MKFDYKGCMAPVFTPFFRDSSLVNYEMIPKYADYMVSSGIKGVLVNGSAGEGLTMSIAERKSVLEAWMVEAKRCKLAVMVQIGGILLNGAIELAKHAESQGVSALLCLPDLFYKPSNGTDLANYLKFISNAAPNTPLLYYHIPCYTSVYIDMVDFTNKAIELVPTFAGVKYTHNNLQEANQLLQMGNHLSVFVGNEQTLAGQKALGLDSCIVVSANCFPDYVQAIHTSIETGNVKHALKLQNNLNATLNLIETRVGGMTLGLKALMEFTAHIDCGSARPPQNKVPRESAEALWKEICAKKLLPRIDHWS
ncbi:N-acetylneuraminate lyase B isoform X2 [Nilaparvata lugens]|uniref:N-acetylneuraminate lyase B isoform X2 n=1 Tax=Nilaparvata lugens TaxID=108931 RepID=UPI00193D9E7B|nr:N-acetylneuraminate lyase B isoform X2 [Nilaparvata lugens]